MSTGGLVSIPQMGELLAALKRKAVPVHSFAVGPRTDLHILGVLAEHTGGVVFIDELTDDKKQPADEIGRLLAKAAGAPLFYVSLLTIDPAVETLFPKEMPPLRTDRATVLIGRGPLASSFKIKAEGLNGSPPQEWTVKPSPPQAGNTFLMNLFTAAEQSQGVSISAAGETLLNAARQAHEERVSQLAAWGHRAVAARNFDAAEKIAWTLRQIDPANVESKTILNAVHKGRTQKVPVKPATPPKTKPKS